MCTVKRPTTEWALGIGLAIGAVALVAVLLLALSSAVLDHSADPTHTPAPSSVAGATQTPGPGSGTPTDTASTGPPTPGPSSLPTLLPTTPPQPTAAPVNSSLPTMLAAIGDSYTMAWSVSPAYPRDHPGFSWVIGSVKGDGVFSLRERFEALGDKLTVVNSATTGRKMSDAVRQATRVVSYAKALPAGATVYVTFELGTNDLCDDPNTDPAVFESQLRDATDILTSGLPKGSRILMLSVPDFSHFYDITQASATAQALLGQTSHSKTCAPFLGTDSPLSIDQARQVLADYDARLAGVCSEIEATSGTAGRVHCLYDEAHLSLRDFTLKDLSTVDYFHPSLSGQNRLATAAWQAGFWAQVKLPSGAAAFAPGGDGTLAFAAVVPVVPPAIRRGRHRPGKGRMRGLRNGGPRPAAVPAVSGSGLL
jgi:lysophospholipase L1-like esterase